MRWVYGFFVVAVVGAGCAGEVDEVSRVSNPGDSMVAQDGEKDGRLESVPLRGLRWESEGRDGAPQPAVICPDENLDPCVWATAAEALVLGEVVGVHPVQEPVAEMNRAGEPGEACAVFVPAIAVDVLIKTAFTGPLEPGETVRLHIGYRRMEVMESVPVWREGELDWIGKDAPLALGQLLLAGAHYVESHDLWSLLGEPLVWSEGGESFQLLGSSEIGDCPEPLPHALQGKTRDAIEGVFETCSFDEDSKSKERRERMRSYWILRGEDYFVGAACFYAVQPHEKGVCSSDTDCPLEEHCVDKRCRPR